MPIQSMEKNCDLASRMEAAIEERRFDVPLLPTVASRILELCHDEEADARQITDLIQSDQSLAAHVMKLANSPVYSPNGNLVSLQQAITRLGMNNISEIAVSSSLNARTFSIPKLQDELDSIWTHSLATALWAKEIARECRNNVECVFLCGLLHSIGKPAVLQLATDLSRNNPDESGLENWRALVNSFHQRLGLAIAAHWKMPRVVVEVLQNIEPFSRAALEHMPTAIVHAATYFAKHLMDPALLPVDQLFELESLQPLNLYQEQVELLVSRMDEVKVCMETLKS